MFLRGTAPAGEPPAQPAAQPAAAAGPARPPETAAAGAALPLPQGAPTLAVQDLVAAAKQYADEKAPGISPEEKRRRLSAADRMSGILDLREMARLILVKQWDKLKPAERERYASLLAALVKKIGYPQIEKFFNGQIELSYAGEKPLDGGAAAVFARIYYKSDDLTLTTEFRLRPTQEGWRIYEVITDGESLLLIYRNQHSGIIKDKGFPQLLKLMEKKLNEAK